MILETFLILTCVFAYIYQRWRHNSQHWARQGVSQPAQDHFPMGNSFVTRKDVLKGERNGGDVVLEYYEQFKHEKYYGVYGPFGTPVLVINDLDLIKDILIKDFSHFSDHFMSFDPFGAESNTLTDQLWTNQMSNLRGDRWKQVRNTFSPIFTSAKMRMMMTFMENVGRAMNDEIEKTVRDDRPVDVKALFGAYSVDTIATCAFGVEAGTMGNSKSEFTEAAMDIFTRKARDTVMFMASLMPGVKQALSAAQVPFFKPKETQFFYDMVTQTMKHRMETGTRRNDLIDLMLDAMRESEAEGKDKEDVLIVATAMIMLVAGYETTAMTLSCCMYQLARHPEIQRKLQDEIDEAMVDGALPAYSAIQEMEYLDMVLHEAMRLHPAVGALPRGCTQDYPVPGTDFVIKKGTDMFISTMGIQRDERYYPNPNEFNPENFSKAAKASRHPMAFLNFGHGPRNCIGMRFALLECKVGLISVLSRYSLTTCVESPD